MLLVKVFPLSNKGIFCWTLCGGLLNVWLGCFCGVSYGGLQVKAEINQKAGVAICDQKLVVVDGAETRELLEAKETLADNGMIDDITLYLNPNDIRVFVKLPNGKAIVATLNTADTPSVVRRKVTPLYPTAYNNNNNNYKR